jgi:heme oxygenase
MTLSKFDTQQHLEEIPYEPTQADWDEYHSCLEEMQRDEANDEFLAEASEHFDINEMAMIQELMEVGLWDD